MSRASPPIRDSSSPADIESEVVCAYQLHAAELTQYATSVARSADSARDAVQEVFLRFFVERRCGRTIEHPRAWLFQVLRNHLTHVRSNPEQREPLPETLESVLDQEQDPERNIAGNELARRVALTLTRRELDCLRLRAQGFGYSEIASLLGISAGTVGALLSRASRKLRPADATAGVFELADALRVLCLNAPGAGKPTVQ